MISGASLRATSRLDGHEKIALSFSGGKDSTACVHLFRHDLDRITVYHVDTGDQLPETREHVAAIAAEVPHFIRIESNVSQWIARHGLPSDLVPYSSHAIGRAMGAAGTPLVPRYDCCFANLMMPVFARVREDGNTLLIRGTRQSDMKRLPITDGAVVDGMEMYYPLLEWSDEDVLGYLRSQQVSLPRFYDTQSNGIDCARCSAWWSEGRNAYLRRFHPELWRQYQRRLQTIVGEIDASLVQLVKETTP